MESVFCDTLYVPPGHQLINYAYPNRRSLKRSLHMKNKKWISLAAAIVLAVTALPMTAFAAKKDEAKLAKVTLNEVAHSIFYAPQYVAIEE